MPAPRDGQQGTQYATKEAGVQSVTTGVFEGSNTPVLFSKFEYAD